MKRLLIPITILLLISGVMASSAAVAPASLAFGSASFTRCVGTLIEGRLDMVAYDSSGNVINDVTPITLTLYPTHSNGALAAETWDYLAGTSVAFAFAAGSSNVTSVSITLVAANGISSPTVTMGCDGSISFSGSISTGPDNRLNPNNCDLTSALYSTRNGIEVWDILPDSKGDYKGAYTRDDIAQFNDAPPSVNTYIGRIGKTTAEVLTTGEFQIKIDEDDEGKECTVILDAIPPTFVYFR